MQKYNLCLGLACVFALALPSSAMASPVTKKDISGKKICWANNNISTFRPGGHYSSPLAGEGTWSMAPGGVALNTPIFVGLLDIDKQPDGTFNSAREGGIGKYCK
jgi:hypothetical protein